MLSAKGGGARIGACIETGSYKQTAVANSRRGWKTKPHCLTATASTQILPEPQVGIRIQTESTQNFSGFEPRAKCLFLEGKKNRVQLKKTKKKNKKAFENDLIWALGKPFGLWRGEVTRHPTGTNGNLEAKKGRGSQPAAHPRLGSVVELLICPHSTANITTWVSPR